MGAKKVDRRQSRWSVYEAVPGGKGTFRRTRRNPHPMHGLYPQVQVQEPTESDAWVRLTVYSDPIGCRMLMVWENY